MNISILRKYYCEDCYNGPGIGAPAIKEEDIDPQEFINFYIVPLVFLCQKSTAHIDFGRISGKDEDFILEYLQKIPCSIAPEELAAVLRKEYPVAIYTFLLHELCSAKSKAKDATIQDIRNIMNHLLQENPMATVSFDRKYKDVRVPICRTTRIPLGDYPENFVIYPKAMGIPSGGHTLFNLAKTPYYKLNKQQTSLLKSAINYGVLLEEDLHAVTMRVPSGKELVERAITVMSEDKIPSDVIALLQNIPKPFLEMHDNNEFYALRALANDANSSIISEDVTVYLESIADYFGDVPSTEPSSDSLIPTGSFEDFMIPPVESDVTPTVPNTVVDSHINPPVEPKSLSCKDILSADLSIEEWARVLNHASQRVHKSDTIVGLHEYLTRYIEETQIDNDCTIKQLQQGLATSTIPTKATSSTEPVYVDNLDKAGKFLVERVREFIQSKPESDRRALYRPVLTAICNCMMIDMERTSDIKSAFNINMKISESQEVRDLLQEAMALADGN